MKTKEDKGITFTYKNRKGTVYQDTKTKVYICMSTYIDPNEDTIGKRIRFLINTGRTLDDLHRNFIKSVDRSHLKLVR